MADPHETQQIDLVISDPSEFGPLRDWLARVPDVSVSQVTDSPAPGEQGAWDVLAILASSSGALAVAIRSLPEFIRSRRSDVTISMRAGDKEVRLDVTNVDDVAALIGKLQHD